MVARQKVFLGRTQYLDITVIVVKNKKCGGSMLINLAVEGINNTCGSQAKWYMCNKPRRSWEGPVGLLSWSDAAEWPRSRGPPSDIRRCDWGWPPPRRSAPHAWSSWRQGSHAPPAWWWGLHACWRCYPFAPLPSWPPS